MRISNKCFLLLTASTAICSVNGNLGSVPVSVSVKDGKFVDVLGLDEPFTYSLKGEAAGFDGEIGVNVDIEFESASLDGVSLPYSFWGTIGRKVGGWSLGTKAKLDVEDLRQSDFSASASNEEWDTSMKVLASPDGVSNVELKQGFSLFGGSSKILVNPKYNLKSSEGDVEVGYYSSDSGTAIKLQADSDKTKLIVSQQVTDTNKLTPSITSDGKFSLQWQKQLSSSGDSITATVSPNDSISLKWNDGPWTANIKTPFNGFEIGELDVGISRKVPFLN